MLFSLASGGLGMTGFIDHYGEPIQHWWKTLRDVTLSSETSKTLVEGVKSEEAGRTFEQLTDERDQRLIAVLKALAAL